MSNQEIVPQGERVAGTATAEYIQEHCQFEMPRCPKYDKLRDIGDPFHELLECLEADGLDVAQLKKYLQAKEALHKYHLATFSNMNDMIYAAHHYPGAKVVWPK
jgi:hypothetical protein